MNSTSCAFVVEPIIHLNVVPREAIRESESAFEFAIPVPTHPRTYEPSAACYPHGLSCLSGTAALMIDHSVLRQPFLLPRSFRRHQHALTFDSRIQRNSTLLGTRLSEHCDAGSLPRARARGAITSYTHPRNFASYSPTPFRLRIELCSLTSRLCATLDTRHHRSPKFPRKIRSGRWRDTLSVCLGASLFSLSTDSILLASFCRVISSRITSCFSWCRHCDHDGSETRENCGRVFSSTGTRSPKSVHRWAHSRPVFHPELLWGRGRVLTPYRIYHDSPHNRSCPLEPYCFTSGSARVAFRSSGHRPRQSKTFLLSTFASIGIDLSTWADIHLTACAQSTMPYGTV